MSSVCDWAASDGQGRSLQESQKLPTMDLETLIHKLRLLEALHTGGATEGEKAAAGAARERLLQRLRELEAVEPAVEYQFSLVDAWSRRLFTALCRRYGLEPYRYRRQRRNTLMLRVQKSFLDQTLWPEYSAFSEILSDYLSEVTDRVISEVLEQKPEDATEKPREEQLMLEM